MRAVRLHPACIWKVGLLGLVLVSGALLLMPRTAPAQSESRAIDEVLVTATRRGQTDIQTTPVSVSAIQADFAEQLVPHDLTDMAVLVPNLIGGNVAGFNAAAFGLRGVGQTSIILYQEAPVGVVVDDFVVPHIQSQALEMFDIESIEALRGPQGTLFGKNTTAGVISVRTKRPDLETSSAEARLLFGNYGQTEVRAALNLAATDTLAFRFAGMKQDSDGYYKAGKVSDSVVGIVAGDGSDLGGDDVFSGRFKALWQPTAEFEALLQYEIIRDNQDSPPIVNETPADPALTFHTLGFTGVSTGDPLDQSAISNRDDGLAIQKGHQVDVDGYYLNLDWQIGDYTLSSVTGYREQETRLPSTYTGEAFASLFDATRDDDRETFQQEVRIASNFGGVFDFVAGAFYQTNDAEFCVVQWLGFLDFFGPDFAPNTLLAGAGLPTLTVNSHNANPSILCNKQDGTAWAAFLDGTWQLNERWSIGAGIRYTDEEKDWAGRSQIYPQFLNGIANFDPDFTLLDLDEPLDAADFGRYPINVQSNSQSWDEATYRLTLSYQATDNVFTWATYAHGFKSGAYNDQTGTSTIGLPFPFPPVAAEPVDPETADSFEIGVKADLADDRVRLNAVYFNVTYEDGQRDLVATIDLGGGNSFQETQFFNAAEIKAQGIELEGSALLTDRITLYGNLGWLDSEYEEFAVDTDFDGVIDQDLSGRDVTRAPELTYTLGATYAHRLGNGDVVWNANVVYEDENIHVYSPVDPAFDGIIEDKTLWNLSATWQSDDERFMVRVFGKNLSDERYRIGKLPVANLWAMTSYGAPRTYGIEVGVKFDF